MLYSVWRSYQVGTRRSVVKAAPSVGPLTACHYYPPKFNQNIAAVRHGLSSGEIDLMLDNCMRGFVVSSCIIGHAICIPSLLYVYSQEK